MKKIAFILTIIIAFYIITNFIVSIYYQLQKKDILVQARLQLQQAKNENTRLKTELNQIQNPQFIEDQARNKLFLVKPGESPIILPLITPTPTQPASKTKI